MSVAEFIELIVATREGVGGHASNFTAVLFAYLVMAYLVADKLSLVHFVGLTLLYSIYQFLPANAAVSDIQLLSALLQNFNETHPEAAAEYIPFGSAFPLAFVLIALGSWLMSVIYGVQRFRTPRKSDAMPGREK